MPLATWTPVIAVWISSIKSDLIVAGGILNAAFAIVHLLYGRLFDWRRELRSLTFVNRGNVQVLNLSQTFVFAMFAYVSLVRTSDLTSSLLGYSLLVLIAVFWLARAVGQVVFFRLRRWSSRVFFLVFLLGAVLYGAPAITAMWPRLAST